MYNRLYKFLQTNNLIYSLQFGFRQKHSNVNAICCDVTQGSILGQLLFLIYINDLQLSIKYCKVHHFADDTNLLSFNNSIKKINKQVGHDLKYLSYCLNSNKICLNFSKTEVVLFKSVSKQTEATLKLKLNGKRLYTTNSVKYLGIKIDENLNGMNRLMMLLLN